MKKIIFLIVLLSGCATQRIYSTNHSNADTMTPSYEQNQAFFLGGIAQWRNTDAAQVCGKRGVSAVETSTTVEDILFTWITFGIYSPRTVAVYCQP